MIYSQKTVRFDDSSVEDFKTTKSNLANGSKTNSKKSANNFLKIGSEAEVEESSDVDKDEEATHVRST